MLDLKILPSVPSLFSFDFLGENASKSYTVAGAFVRFIRAKFGAATLRAWYGGESLTTLTKHLNKGLELYTDVLVEA